MALGPSLGRNGGGSGGGGGGSGDPNAILAGTAAAGAGLLWVSDGADRSAEATDTVAAINTTALAATSFTFNGVSVTGPTGTGNMVLGTSPTLVTPVLGTPASGNLSNCTADGTNPVGTKNLPQNAKTGSYTLLASDSGKVVPNTTGGWTVNNSVHAAGDIVSLYNDSGSSQNITQGTITTMRLGGSTTTGTRALAARGIATLYFHSATEVVVSGVGVT